MAYFCQKLRVLPGPGGLMEQDSYYMWLIKAVLDAQAEREHLEYLKNKPK